MNLSKQTIAILKLFASVNENLMFKAGKKQRTITTDEGIFIEAEIEEDLPRDFPICGLGTFVRNLEISPDTTFDLGDKHIAIKTGNTVLRYGYGAAALIKSPPYKSLVIPDGVASVSIEGNELAMVMKIAEINSLPNIKLGSDGENFYLMAFDAKNQDSVSTTIQLTKNKPNKGSDTWSETFSFERFSKLSTSSAYEAKVVPGKYVSFVGDKISLAIAVER
jgi:hypothetical protein